MQDTHEARVHTTWGFGMAEAADDMMKNDTSVSEKSHYCACVEWNVMKLTSSSVKPVCLLTSIPFRRSDMNVTPGKVVSLLLYAISVNLVFQSVCIKVY